MRFLSLCAFGIVLAASLTAQSAGTFFSFLDAERGSTVAAASGGNIWLGAMKDERVLLIKCSPSGKILDKHSIGFEGSGLDGEHLVDFFEDSDGSLVGCGIFEGDNLGRSFVFRYNPTTRKLLWSQIVRSSGLNYLYGITQNGPGGDYVLYGHPFAINGDDAELLRLHRATGAIVPGKAKRLGLGKSDNFNQLLYHKGALYALGHFTNAPANFNAPERTRSGLCKLDTATLEPVWTRIGPLPTNALARLYGRDLIVDDEALVSTLSGDATGPELFSSTIFLQKHDLAGNLLWVRQYDLPDWKTEFAEEVVALPDGYMLYGHESQGDTSQLFLLKTDKNGFPLSAVKIAFDLSCRFPEIPARSKLLRLGDALFGAALSQNSVGQTQCIYFKTDLDGRIGDDCGFVTPTAVQLVPMPQPVSEAVVPAVSASPAMLENATNTLTTPDLSNFKVCGATGTCPGLPDLHLSVDSITCRNGVPLLYYTICNVGGQPYDGTYTLLFYDKNPLTDSARIVTGFIGSGDQPLLPGDCISGIPFSSGIDQPDPFELDTFAKLYGLIGGNFAVLPPIPAGGFPYSPSLPECSYQNNLDSIQVPPMLCGDCKTPSTFVKKLGTAPRQELAFSMCTAADGNVYLAGRREADPMIAKITPLGEPVWVRYFPSSNPNEAIALAEIIEDSEGKLVLCGTQGESPSTRRVLIMRYDPQGDTIIWYKHLFPIHPEATGILEEKPGGNFLLFTKSQVTSGIRSEIWEIDRHTGLAVTGGLNWRYGQNQNVRLESVVTYQGNLYGVGSRYATNAQPLFVKIASDGTVIWAQETVADSVNAITTRYAHSEIVMDADLFLLAGTAQRNPNDPADGVYTYLEKHAADGSLLWMKRYDISITPEDVVVLHDAYIVFGIMANNRWGLLKTDKQGKLLYAKTLQISSAPPVSSFFYPNRQNQLIRIGNDLLMADHTQGSIGNDILLLRTDINLGLDDSCSLLQTVQADVQIMPAKTAPMALNRSGFGASTADADVQFQTDSLPVSKFCPKCACEGLTDVRFSVNSIFCGPDSSLRYQAKVCNTGEAAVPAPFEVVFYDKNPLTEAAQAVWSITVSAPLGSGACDETAWPLPAVAAQYAKLYTFAGATTATPTPLNLQQLAAASALPDCRWDNNLDSFTVQTPLCNGCENPSTFFKTMGRADRDELGYSLCTASDGNVYMAGRQGKNPMIAKMTPNGQMIWVRNFPAGTDAEPVELAEMLEDAEGKLVLCGTEGLSVNTRKAVAMRYDPVTDQVLWFKQYPELTPQALGIFEKTPGGNLVLYSFSDELFPGGPPFGNYYKARSEVWELDHTTGAIVPTLATQLTGAPSVYLQHLLPYAGSLYGVGGWSDAGNGRLMLIKLSASDGTPDWIHGILPDSTAQHNLFNFTNIMADSGLLVVLGGGFVRFGTPDQQQLVYLSKFTPEGTLLWMKSYEITGAMEDIVALPDGYVIFGRAQGNSWILFKTDKDGNLLATRKITLPGTPGFTFRYFRQHQLLRLPQHLLVADDFKGAVYQDIVLIKTDYNLNLDDSCGLVQPFPVNVNALPARMEPIFTNFQPYGVKADDKQAIFQADSLSSKQVCPQCPCTDKPDINCRLQQIYCSATEGVVADFLVCNSGQVAAPTGFKLTFYDKNPLTTAAAPLYSTTVTLAPGFGDCIPFTLPLNPALQQHSRLYTLAGVWSDVQTPVALDGFPYSGGFAECDYRNNLDSFDLVLPAPQKPNLGPDLLRCTGQTATLDAGPGYTAYQWLNGPATQTYTVGASGNYVVQATDACGRTLRDTVQVTILPQVPPTTQVIAFYPGDTVTIAGTAYTQPGTVTRTLSAANGCDSVVTYILQFVVTDLAINCPASLTVALPPNQSTAPVSYALPTASTDCPNPNVAIHLLQGPPSGAAFGSGITSVCYEAANQCGIRDSCCFSVTLQPSLSDEPCDVKVPPGSCIRYELLDIRADAQGRPRYRIRLTNTCASPLRFAYIQLPDGLQAAAPKDGSTYTAPGGNTYAVRNPNASPFHSIRFRPLAGSLSNGASDVFEYTLPKQAAPTFIHVAAKLDNGQSSEAHLNTFGCPVLPYTATLQDAADTDRGADVLALAPPNGIQVYPNPNTGLLYVSLERMPAEVVQLQVLNAQGQLVWDGVFAPENGSISLALPDKLANGLYYLMVQPAGGMRVAARFVLER